MQIPRGKHSEALAGDFSDVESRTRWERYLCGEVGVGKKVFMNSRRDKTFTLSSGFRRIGRIVANLIFKGSYEPSRKLVSVHWSCRKRRMSPISARGIKRVRTLCHFLRG